MAQLGRETDDVVKVRILRALGSPDLLAINQMLNLVGPAQSDMVRIAAADGIRSGSKTINGDPKLKQSAIDTLTNILPGTEVPGEENLRTAIVGALSQISDQQLSAVFAPLILPTESVPVRANALLGLGNLPNPASYGGQIARTLEDQSPALRVAAAEALRHVPPGPSLILAMLNHLTGDSDDNVRSKAWSVLLDWAREPDLDEAYLSQIVGGLQNDPAKELAVQQILCDRLAADAQNAKLSDDQRKTAAQNLAEQQQNLGDICMKPAVNLFLKAADAYQTALDYWKKNNGQPEVIKKLCEGIASAYLSARRWNDAANFAAGVVRDYSNDPNLRQVPVQVALVFRGVANSYLMNSQDPAAYTDAMAMLDAVEKMSPALPGSNPEILQTIRQRIEARHAAPAPPGQ